MTDIDVAEANKARFLEAFARFAEGDTTVLADILRADFVSHTPGVPAGRDAWIEFIEGSPVASAELELIHVVADAQLVVAHYTLTLPDLREAVADFWRFEDGLIVEHWDVTAQLP